LEILPLYFSPHHMLRAEGRVYDFMGSLCADYDGGYWEYYELSNGGFYMAPKSDKRHMIEVAGNFYSGEMSADAAGIVACLFAFSELAERTRDERFIHLYWQLREYAQEHAEFLAIRRAID
jgi:hypothetical protein